MYTLSDISYSNKATKFFCAALGEKRGGKRRGNSLLVPINPPAYQVVSFSAHGICYTPGIARNEV